MAQLSPFLADEDDNEKGTPIASPRIDSVADVFSESADNSSGKADSPVSDVKVAQFQRLERDLVQDVRVADPPRAETPVRELTPTVRGQTRQTTTPVQARTSALSVAPLAVDSSNDVVSQLVRNSYREDTDGLQTIRRPLREG